MKRISYYTAFVLLTSCTGGYRMHTVGLEPILHDSNSKVWQVEQQIINGVNVAPKNTLDKDAIVFYNNGNCALFNLKGLGRTQFLKGQFEVNTGSQIVKILFEKKKWEFNFEYITEDSIKLIAKENSDLKNDLKLVPLGEF